MQQNSAIFRTNNMYRLIFLRYMVCNQYQKNYKKSLKKNIKINF